MKKELKFSDFRVGILGDLMLDKYIIGDVERISPEAPVPVIAVKRESYVPGGAANTACNIASLKAKAILIGVLGDDLARRRLTDSAESFGIDTSSLVIDSQKTTTEKIRVIGQSQQLVRIDYESREYIGEETSARLWKAMEDLKDVNAFVVSDYAKGVVTKDLLGQLIKKSQAENFPIIVDPKPEHRDWYEGVSLITPNRKEAEAMVGYSLENVREVEKAGLELQSRLKCDVLITMGAKGMVLFEKNNAPLHIPTLAREVFDVSGAGDTVVATLSLAICAGWSLEEAATLANRAAGVKVGKLGTAPVSLEEIQRELQE